MKLIIAEKPSLGRNIAAALGARTRRDGCLEGSGYIVTWAFGHLFSLEDIEHYSPSESGRWCMDNLPCFPEKFDYKLRSGADGRADDGIERQFNIIKKLCLRDDVDEIVNAGDADREGEIIIRLCIDKTGVTGKRRTRMWLPDQTPETIRESAEALKDEKEYDLLAGEGYARTFTDWLYGVNLTRYATLRTGTLLRVGRVIVPIVRAIYERDMSIRNFKPDIYYAAVSKAQTNGITVELTSKNKFPREKADDARALCEKYNAAGAVVTSVKKKRDVIKPGKLYSLSKLQNYLGKKYKMPMDESLALTQKLYEDGYLTYPRTNSEYLATAEKDKIRSIISVVAGKGYPVTFKDGKSIFDDSKIESHSALTPTYKFPDPARLTDREKLVYAAVLSRFTAVFCSRDCVADRTTVTVKCADEEFTLKGTVIVEQGWTKFDDCPTKDKILPALSRGDSVNVDFKAEEKQTSPPKHYTIETLNNYLKNPFREDKARLRDAEEGAETDDSEDYRALFEGLELGTEATRTGIIENARKSGYIQLKKDVYTILPAGEYLIESLGRMNINMDKYKTSEMGKALKRVFRGESSVDDAVSLARAEIAEVFAKKEAPPEKDRDIGFYGEEVGRCPLCGNAVTRTKFGYGCRGYKEGCRFGVSMTICGRVISPSNMRMLLESGSTSKIEGFVSARTGGNFDARLRLDGGKAVFDFTA